MAKSSEKIDVYVKIPTGRNAQYNVTPNSTIETICQQIASEEKVKPAQVRLKYQGKILNRDHTMVYLGVRAETILKAEILVPRHVNIKVKLPTDLGDVEMSSTNLDKVKDLISRVAEHIKEDSSRIALKYEGRVVKGDTLMDAGLVDGSVLEAELKDPPTPSKECTGAEARVQKNEEMKEEDKQEILGSFDAGGRRVEVVFSFDTTGSMYSCLEQVRSNLRDCCTRLIQDVPNIRIGIIAHGDYCDQENYVIRSVDLTTDVQTVVDFVQNVPKTSGDDCPECYEWVLRKAQFLDWSEDSAKALVVIGDAVPHPPGYTDADVFWRDELDVLTGMGVKVYGVQALNMTSSKPFYEELAAVSGGKYLTLQHFNIITDMFLAVCYRESNEEDLATFVREVEEAGRMTEERKEMFQQLASPSSCAARSEDQPKKIVREPWWDPRMHKYNGRIMYHYDQTKDHWSQMPNSGPMPKHRSPMPKHSGHKKERKCSIM